MLIFLLVHLKTNAQSYKLASFDSVSVKKYPEIDNYAKHAPLFVGLSYKKLSSYLTKPYTSDEDKVRSISYWISQHIKYNFKKANRVKTYLQNPNETLLKRTGICGDYTLLFDKLCEHAGIQSEIIDGYSKGFYFEPNDTLIRADHTWNAVLIDNEWKLIDVLWLSGNAQSKKQLFRRFLYWSFNIKFTQKYKFVKKLNEEFYLAQPEKFADSHLPLNSWWQLLNIPTPVDVFEENQFEINVTKEDSLLMYDFNGKIWQDINGEKPDIFLYNGKKATQFNERNNKVLFDAYFNYGQYLAVETSISELSNEEKIEIYDNAVDSLKKAKHFNKLYKQNISEEKIRRHSKNKVFYNNLKQRNNQHINADRKIKNKNYQLNDQLINTISKIKNENHRLSAEQDRIKKQSIKEVNSKEKKDGINYELIIANNHQIELFKDSILQLKLINRYFINDSLNEIERLRQSAVLEIDSTFNLSADVINETCETRHVFNFDWYYADYIDSLEITLITHFNNKDNLFNLLHNNYLRHITISKEIITNNKKISKNYASILKLIKENKKNDITDKHYDELYENSKNDWSAFNENAKNKNGSNSNLIRRELKKLTKSIRYEEKQLKKEKNIEIKRYASWNTYYIRYKLKWLKRAGLDDEKTNKTIKLINIMKKKAKEEIKKAEAKEKRKIAKMK